MDELDRIAADIAGRATVLYVQEVTRALVAPATEGVMIANAALRQLESLLGRLNQAADEASPPHIDWLRATADLLPALARSIAARKDELAPLHPEMGLADTVPDSARRVFAALYEAVRQSLRQTPSEGRP